MQPSASDFVGVGLLDTEGFGAVSIDCDFFPFVLSHDRSFLLSLCAERFIWCFALL